MRVTTTIAAAVIGLALIAIIGVGVEIPVVAATVVVPTSAAGPQTQLVVYHGSWGFHCYQDYGNWHCPDSESGP